MENKMTIKEVLETDIKILSGITFTVEDIERIGVPISDVTKSLKACIEAINIAERKEKEVVTEVIENVGESEPVEQLNN